MNEAGTILQETECFPFGLAIPRTAGTNKYLYNGKEKQPETGLLDYGARQYDPSIGRWMTVDPLSELDENVSPYTYVINSPTTMVDPLGMHPDSGANYAPGTNVETQYGSYTWTGEKWITHWEKSTDGGNTPTLYVPQFEIGSGNSQGQAQLRPNYDRERMNSAPILTWSNIGDANGVIGTVAGYKSDIEKSKLTFRFLKDLKPRFYASGWARRAGMKTMNVASAAGKLSMIGSFVLDGLAWNNDEQSGLKTVVNIGVTGGAFLIGSVEGFVLGTGYFVIDKTVGWENAMELGANYQNQQRALGLPTKFY